MDMTDAFPSKYIRSEDLGNNTVKVIIESVSIDDVSKEGEKSCEKPVVTLRGRSKAWVLNKTNNTALIGFFGKDSEGWKGKEVELFVVPCSINGRATQGIRCRLPADPAVDADVKF